MHSLIKKASSQLLLDLSAESKKTQDHSADHSLAQHSAEAENHQSRPMHFTFEYVYESIRDLIKM